MSFVVEPGKIEVGLNVGWTGPKVWENDLTIEVVELAFKESVNKVIVDLTEDIKSDEITILRFRYKTLDQERIGARLLLTIDRIQNFIVKAGVFQRNKLEVGTVRTDKVIDLKMPEELKIGQTYTLLIQSSNSTILTAELEETEIEKD